MKPKLVTLTLVAVLVVVGFWLGQSGSLETGEDGVLAGEVVLNLPDQPKVLQGDRIPPDFFIVKTNQEEILALSDIKDKFIFINFWNTWCSVCRNGMPDLHKLYLEYKNRNVEFVLINITEQEKNLEDVNSFLADNQYNLPVYLDRQGDIARLYGIGAIPTTVVINPAGELVYAAAGPINYNQAKSLIDPDV